MASPQELAHRLTMAGLEVSSISVIGAEFESIVVAKIEEISPHPNADRLLLCRVFNGKEILNIVCGAHNMKVGDKVALAPVGVVLPNGTKIKASKIRGVISEGMLCSGEELGIEEHSTGIFILPSELEVGRDLASALLLKDYVLDIDLTPNRPDCLSVIGIAREIAALYNLSVKLPSITVPEESQRVEEFIQVKVEVPELCPRYTARYIYNVKIKPSPLWMRRRLESVGVRAINNVVDITNYVLLELGQPLHAFDYALLDQGKIIVKKASSGEKFFTLDNKERVLDEDVVMICDASKPVAMGGVMGGLNTEVTEKTQCLLLESAFFNPRTILKTSRKLGIKTESSLRFERGVNPETVVLALNRAAQLVADLAEGKVAKGIIDIYPNPLPSPPKIILNPQRVNWILGTEISRENMSHCLESLGIKVEPRPEPEEELVAAVPSYRPDLKEEIDLIEEIARIYGYDQISPTLPEMSIAEGDSKFLFSQESKVRSLLVQSGFFEVITYSFISPEMVKALKLPDSHPLAKYIAISNPLSKDQSVMRTTLIPGLLATVVTNHKYKNMDLKIFEIGKVFLPEEGKNLPQEKLMLGGLICGLRASESWNNPKEEVDFYDLKGVLENIFYLLSLKNVDFQSDKSVSYLHPGLCSRILLEGTTVGFLGEVHPEVLDYLEISKKIFVFEVDFNKIINYCDKKEKRIKPIPRYPAIARDIALIVDDKIEWQVIEKEVLEAKIQYLDEIKLFDVYRGDPIPKGEKSLAFRMTFQASNRSLTDEEVNLFIEKILSHLKRKINYELRK